MNFFFSTIFVSISAIIFIRLCNKYNFLLNFNGDLHQKYTTSKHIPLVGGTITLLFIFFFTDFNFLIKFFSFNMFVIGILSDLKLLEAPKKKLLLQFLFIILFLYGLDIHLVSTQFQLLDFLLGNVFFSFLFTAFCILTVINGTNFIDGNNNNVLGYYLSISCVLFFLSKNGISSIGDNNNLLLLELIFILLIFNSLNKVYLGDSGAFLFGSIFSLILIEFYLHNPGTLSAFFIVLLLWYPAFENLFSIIRKFYFSKSPTDADNNHLHQLLYFFLTKKFIWNKILLNNSVGLLINFYNFIILFIGATNPNHTQFMIFLIFINLIVYILLYLSLFQFKKLYLKK